MGLEDINKYIEEHKTEFFADIKRENEMWRYLCAVEDRMVDVLGCHREAVARKWVEDNIYLYELFSEDADVIYHDDPLRLARSLAVRWGMIDQVEPNIIR